MGWRGRGTSCSYQRPCRSMTRRSPCTLCYFFFPPKLPCCKFMRGLDKLVYKELVHFELFPIFSPLEHEQFVPTTATWCCRYAREVDGVASPLHGLGYTLALETAPTNKLELAPGLKLDFKGLVCRDAVEALTLILFAFDPECLDMTITDPCSSSPWSSDIRRRKGSGRRRRKRSKWNVQGHAHKLRPHPLIPSS